MGIRELKSRIGQLLGQDNFEDALETIRRMPGRQAVNPLFSFLYSGEEIIRWRAVTAMGAVVGHLADTAIESARVVMRRFMWSLNDESGGIGWGAPEAMGEIMAGHDKLAEEYGHMLVAYMREDGFYLELPQLQQGLMWGLARLTMAKPDLLKAKNVVAYLLPYLDSHDSTVRGLAAWTLGLLHAGEAVSYLERLANDPAQVTIFLNRTFVPDTVGSLAHKALANIAKES